MKQTNSQMQFLQLVCVVLVMSTLIGLVASYIMFRDVRNLEQQLAEAKVQTDACKSDRVDLSEQLNILKSLTGYNMSDVGQEDSVDENTIVGKARSDINRRAGSLTRPTLRDALYHLHDRLIQVTNERNDLRKELDKLAATQSSPGAN